MTSHLSAARHWGWPVKWPPDRPWVTVRRKRHLDAETRAVVNVSYADLTPDEIVDGVTSPLRTVLDCARRLPFDEALAVADSALRAGAVTRAKLVAGAAAMRGRGATQARRVAAEATAKAANPFESVLRALVLEFPRLTVSPQLPITARGRTWHRTWSTRRDAWSWRPTRGSSTRPGRRTPETASDTPRWCWPGGTSSGSPGSR